MLRRFRWPSPALVIASLALFVALGGTAFAAGIVPHARVADNSLKLQGKSAAEVAALAPAPSTVGGLVSIHSTPWSLAGNQEASFTARCDAGQRAVGGGYDNPTGAAIAYDSKPGSDGASWTIDEFNEFTTQTSSGTVYVVCIK
jgi:hypothetical protein